ncbi:MAG: hypothetical protein ACREMY_24375 [bacterium]
MPSGLRWYVPDSIWAMGRLYLVTTSVPFKTFTSVVFNPATSDSLAPVVASMREDGAVTSSTESPAGPVLRRPQDGRKLGVRDELHRDGLQLRWGDLGDR